eukprot:SAG31_NODE_5125_length_2727_cov_1.282725_1_plen_551_part_00
MQEWYSMGYFPPDRLVKRNADAEFVQVRLCPQIASVTTMLQTPLLAPKNPLLSLGGGSGGGRDFGKVKMWNDERGYGFVISNNGGPDIFVHKKELVGGTALQRDQPVSYLAEMSADGKTKGVDVRNPDGSPLDVGGNLSGIDREIQLPAVVANLIRSREQARRAKDWNEADRLRDMLREHGYQIDDQRRRWTNGPRSGSIEPYQSGGRHAGGISGQSTNANAQSIVLAPAPAPPAPVDDDELERRRKRAERFGAGAGSTTSNAVSPSGGVSTDKGSKVVSLASSSSSRSSALDKPLATGGKSTKRLGISDANALPILDVQVGIESAYGKTERSVGHVDSPWERARQRDTYKVDHKPSSKNSPVLQANKASADSKSTSNRPVYNAVVPPRGRMSVLPAWMTAANKNKPPEKSGQPAEAEPRRGPLRDPSPERSQNEEGRYHGRRASDGHRDAKRKGRVDPNDRILDKGRDERDERRRVDHRGQAGHGISKLSGHENEAPYGQSLRRNVRERDHSKFEKRVREEAEQVRVAAAREARTAAGEACCTIFCSLH